MAQLPVKSQTGSITFLFFIISIIIYYDLSIGSLPDVINKSSAFEKHSIRRARWGNNSVKDREKKEEPDESSSSYSYLYTLVGTKKEKHVR